MSDPPQTSSIQPAPPGSGGGEGGTCPPEQWGERIAEHLSGHWSVADGMWRGTCRGAAVDISAPGQNVFRATLPSGTGQGQGTSFAVALTAGVVAALGGGVPLLAQRRVQQPLDGMALAQSVERTLQGRRPQKLVASYHGMPVRYLHEGDPYHCHCRKTARLLEVLWAEVNDTGAVV